MAFTFENSDVSVLVLSKNIYNNILRMTMSFNTFVKCYSASDVESDKHILSQWYICTITSGDGKIHRAKCNYFSQVIKFVKRTRLLGLRVSPPTPRSIEVEELKTPKFCMVCLEGCVGECDREDLEEDLTNSELYCSTQKKSKSKDFKLDDNDDESWYKPYPSVDVPHQQKPKWQKNAIMTLIHKGNGLAKSLASFLNYARTSLRRKKEIEFEIELAKLTRQDHVSVDLDPAKPQMEQEGPQGAITELTAVSSSNVVIESQRVPSVAVSDPVGDFRAMCAATENANFESICDRWFSMDSVKWSATKARGAVIQRWILPRDPVLKYMGKISNFIPFSTFKYMSCDIDVRVELNSNKFQAGQLQLSWMYGAGSDKNFTEIRENIYNASQRMHTLLSAGSSNSAEMHIPFKYVNSYLSCRKMSNSFTHDLLDMGTLTCMVLNPLTTPETTYKTANLNLFIKFSNVKFVGMREVSSDLSASPQMLGAIAEGSRLISNVTGYLARVLDNNCDKPLAPTPPTVLIPTAVNSFAYTDGVAEQMPTMRNLPLAQTPSLFDPSQMEISEISSIYGLITTKTWSHNDDVGKELFNLPASPVFDRKYYNSIQKDESLVYHYPPVAYISSLFNYWRGELELRMDFISTSFHTGKLMIVYIPGGTEDGPTDYESLKSCPNKVFDLNENRQCNLEIPFIASKPWWPRVHTGKNNEGVGAPAWIRVFVLNPLIPMEAVSASIDINIYWRGVKGLFEVAVPIYPSVGLSFDASVKPIDGGFCQTIYSPFFTTWYYYLNKNALTLFYSEVAGHYVQFWSMKMGAIYSTERIWIDDVAYPCRLPYYQKAETLAYVTHIVRARNRWSQATAFCFGSLADAKKYADSGDQSGLLPFIKEGDWVQYKKDGKWLKAPSANIKFKEITTRDIVDDVLGTSSGFYDFINVSNDSAHPQMDGDVNEPTRLLVPAKSTSYGLKTFGEQITSLKSLGRRFNNYGEFKIKAHFVTIVPVIFDRLDLDLTSATYSDNTYRDGTLPIILSAFRFVRGGLRFKLFFRRALPRSTNVIVMFDPEYKALNRSITTEPMCLTFNYNTIAQNTRVNEILEFEIPYYRSGQYNLLQKPKANEDDNLMEFFSLGALRIVTTSDANLDAILAYSLADDTLVDEFIGFPPALPINQEIEVAVPQMETTINNKSWVNVNMPTFELIQNKMCDKIENVVENTVHPAITTATENLVEITDTVKEVANETGESMKAITDASRRTIEDATGKVTNILDDVTKTSKEVAGEANGIIKNTGSILQNVTEVMEAIKTSFGWLGDKMIYLKDIVTHLLYAMFSPTVLVITFAVVNILYIMFGGLVSIGTDFDFMSIQESMMRIAKGYFVTGALFNMTSSKPKIDDDATPQGEGLTDDFITFGKFILKMFKLPVSYLPDGMSLIIRSYDAMGRRATAGNQIRRFVTDNVDCFRRLWAWAMNIVCDDSQVLSYLSDSKGKATLEKFIKGVSIVTNPVHRYKVINTPIWSTFTYRLYRMGINLSIKMTQEKESRLNSILSPYMKKISELYDELVRNKINSPAPYEPFVIYLAGAPGVGKSTIADGLCIDLLEKTKVTFDGPAVFTKTPATAFWNGLCGQPICKFDDFMQVTDANDTSLSDFFSLKSDGQFNPSQAAIEDKSVLYNPLIVIMNSNTKFPKSPRVLDENALWRRRDVMVEMVYKSKGSNDTMISHGAYTNEEIVAVEHADFLVYADPGSDSSSSTKMDFVKFKEHLYDTYTKYVAKETRLFDARVKNLTRLWKKESDSADFAAMMDGLSENLDSCLDDIVDVQHGSEEASKVVEADPQMDVGRSDVYDHLAHVLAADDFHDMESMPMHINTDSDQYKSICIQQYDEVTKLVDNSLGFNMHVARELCHDTILNGEGIGTDSLCCLHNYLDCDSACRVYDEESKCYIMADLLIPEDQCKVRRVNGNVEVFEGCLFKDLDYVRQYGMDVLKSSARFTYNTRVPVPESLTFKKQYPEASFKLERMEGLVENLCDANEVIEVDESDVSFINKEKLSVRSRIVVNFKKLAKRLTGFMFKLYQWLVENWKKFVGMCAAISVALGLILKFTGYMKPGDDEYAEEEGSGAMKNYDGGSSFKSKTVKTRLTTAKVADLRGPVSDAEWKTSWANPDSCWGEADICTEHTRALFNKVSGNFFFIRCLRAEGVIRARCLGIRGHLALMPYHYVEHFLEMEKNHKCMFDVITASGVNIALSEHPFGEINRLKTSDGNYTGMCTVEMPSTIGMFKDIVNWFLTDETQFPSYGIMLTIHEDKFKTFREVTTLPLATNVVQHVQGGMFTSPWSIADGFSYPKQNPGMCGSIMIAEFRGGPKIIGFHTAGKEKLGVGFSEPIMKYYFERKEIIDRDTTPFRREGFTAFDVLDAGSAKQQLDTNVTPLFCLPKDKVPRQARITKLEPSLIAGEVYPVTYGPAVLTPKDKRLDASKGDSGFVNPIFCGSRKRGMIPTVFKTGMLHKCADHLKSKILKLAKPMRSSIGKLKMTEAVNGIPLRHGYDKMDLSTSEGYPWVLERPRGAKDKSYLFYKDEDEQVVGINSQVGLRVSGTNTCRERGVIPFSIYQGCLKDEKKPLEKIPIPGKTRLFELSAVDVTISHRMYTQDFIAAYTGARIVGEHAVGMNVDSNEWTMLYEYLTSFSSDILVCDYSNFGPTLQFACIQESFEIINEWYRLYQTEDAQDIDKHNLARRCIAYEIGHAVQVCEDMVYRTHGGLPSGCTTTVYLNSMANCLYLRYAFLEIVEKNGLNYTLDDFDDLVRPVTYGDDLIIAVKPKFLRYYNSVSLSEVFGEYGIKLTDVSKGDTMRKSCSIEEASFLKRGFRPFTKGHGCHANKVVLAPLERRVVCETSNWTHKQENTTDASKEVVLASMRMMFGHGPKAYYAHCTKLAKVFLAKTQVAITYPKWDDIFDECYEFEDFALSQMCTGANAC